MRPTKIIFLVLPQVHLLDLAGAVQVFQEAIELGAELSMDYCSIGQAGIQTAAQFPLGELKHFSEIKLGQGDYLVVPGCAISYMLSKQVLAEKKLLQWVQSTYEEGANVCSICTGAFFLGVAGLLNGKKCTTHWKRTSQLKAKFPAIHLLEDVLFTDDDRILTSAGVSAGIDLALHIVSKLGGENLAFKVARELVLYIRRNGNHPQQSIFIQYRNHINSGIHRVQDYMQDQLEKGVSLPILSDVACMSTRNLTRAFKRETGITINGYLSLVRKEKIKQLMKNTDYTRKQLAHFCGLKSERQIIRLMKQ